MKSCVKYLLKTFCGCYRFRAKESTPFGGNETMKGAFLVIIQVIQGDPKSSNTPE